MSYIMMALAWVLNLFYNITLNYGLAIIFFTIVIKLILLPLTIKQQKSMVKTQKIQPLLMELQQKYANDKDKLSQETMKLYQKYKINPMSGCLPLVIQLPILMALYYVVRLPITYTMGVDGSEIWRIINAIEDWAVNHQDALQNLFTSLKIENFDVFRDNQFKNFGMYEIQIAHFLQANPDILQSHWITEGGEAYKTINFAFCGLDISQTPDLWALLGIFMGKLEGLTPQVMLLWLIPILSGVSSFVTSKVSQAQQPPQPVKKDEFGREKSNPMKTMMVFMPLFSAWLAFTLPAAIGLYWIISNVLQLVQQVLVTKFVNVGISEEEIEGEVVNAKKSRKKRKKR